MQLADRWFTTGVEVSPEEYGHAVAPKGFVLVEFDYFYDDIRKDGFVLEGVNYDYEKFVPKRGTIKSVSPYVISDGYSWLPDFRAKEGDKVWFTPFAGYNSAGKSEAGKAANKALWTPGRYCVAVRHQDIVVSQDSGGEYSSQNGFVLLDDVEPVGTGKQMYWLARLATEFVPNIWDKQPWPLDIAVGDRVILRTVPLRVEYEDVAELNLWHSRPEFVMGKTD